MHKLILLSSIALSALAANAFASDLPTKKGPPPAPTIVMAPFSWAGFYVGVNGGYADPTAKLSVTPGGLWANPKLDDDWPYFSPASPGIGNAGAAAIGLHGFIGGAQAGYNAQFNNLVLGVEADADYMSLNGSYATIKYDGVGGPPAQYWASGKASVDSLFTIRARAGLAFDRLLVFVTGGVAFTDEKFSQSINFVNPGVILTLPPTLAGGGANAGSASSLVVTGVVGAGLEYAFDNHWSLKGEYLYVPLKSENFSSTYVSGGNWTIQHHESLSALNVFRVGLNYRFP